MKTQTPRKHKKAPRLTDQAYRILKTLDATQSKMLFDEMRMSLERVSLSEGLNAGEYFVAAVICDVLNAVPDNGRYQSVLADICALSNFHGFKNSMTKTLPLRREIVRLKSTGDYINNHKRLADSIVEPGYRSLAVLLRHKLTSLLIAEMKPVLSSDATPSLQIFRELRHVPPELLDYCLFFLRYDVSANRYRLAYPQRLTSGDSMNTIRTVATTVDRLAPILPRAALKSAWSTIHAVMRGKLRVLRQELAEAEQLEAALVEKGAHNFSGK